MVVALLDWQIWWAEATTGLVADIASLVAVIAAACCSAWAARTTTGHVRHGWLAMTAGLLAWAVGALNWSYHATRGAVVSPPSSVVMYGAFVLFSIGAGTALIYFTPRMSWTSKTRLMLDAAIVATSLFVVGWVTVLDRTFHAGGSPLAVGLMLTYLIAHVALIAITALLWAGESRSQRRNIGLLAAGVLVASASDLPVPYLFAADHLALVFDLGRIVGFWLLALAALCGIEESAVEPAPVRRPSKARTWLPYLPLPVAVIAWFWQVVADVGTALLLMAVVLVVTVLGRQAVVLLENQRLLSDVSRLAFWDQLTGLPNRELLHHRLEQAVELHRRERVSLAVLCLDLDNFKTVNDEMGHAAGDELLVRVADRLRGCVRSEDTVARLGGDEFAVLIEGSIDDSQLLADRILKEFDSPIEVDGVALTVQPSIGMTLTGSDAAPVSVDSLLRRADLAMYSAKRDGGGCVRTYVPQPAGERDLRPSPGRDAPSEVVTPAAPRPDAVAERALWPPLAVRFALGALLAGVLVFAISTVVRTSPGRIPLLDSWWEVGLEFFAAGLVAVRGVHVAEERRAWLFIAAGLSATAMGSVVYAVWAREGQLPSAADLVYLAFYPLIYTGLVLLIRARLQRVPTAIRLDALVAGFTAAAVAAALAAGPIAAVQSGAPAAVLVGLAYPAGGLLLLAMATGTLAILGWRTDWRWALIVAGFVLWVIANTIYLFRTTDGSYREGTWIDACWPTAFLLIALAAWVRPTSVPTTPRTGLGSLVPSILCAVAALGVSVFAHQDPVAVAAVAMSLTAVAARFAVTYRDLHTRALSCEQALAR
ncbi:GGDEF domain-containing protein [Mycobacterium deserti]|uniref:GGDEF domain-containing protein n=1 Tax=Mycobacterium deserti TaxID=2978347 RepID=A0ABT2MBB6_9MYCO|nr:GGDEF domain-containing protein [Mycobacterium deserti]MCT7658705.1 GGDEF domain-containing protein [Mycobacterium deserti]